MTPDYKLLLISCRRELDGENEQTREIMMRWSRDTE